jgi:hypothetical protein
MFFMSNARRVWGLGLAALVLAACNEHPQLDGRYALTLDQVIRDDCGMASNPELVESMHYLNTGELVRVDYSLYDIQLVGSFLADSERFSADGSSANVNTLVSGQQCLLDLVTVHLDAATVSPQAFSGALSVRLDARRPDSCVCELWVTYAAQLVDPPP